MRTALSAFDEDGELLGDGEYCFKHVPDPEETSRRFMKYMTVHDKIVGINASGLTFDDTDLGDVHTTKRFYGCNFQHCFFRGLRYDGVRCRLCSFDFAVFTDCNLLKSNIQFSSYAGARFIHVLFTGSDLILDNFSGISSFQSSFDDSDLYNSHFVRANLVDTSFRNCNIKKTVFYEINQRNVSFKLSNTREAVFDECGSALFTGGEEQLPGGIIK